MRFSFRTRSRQIRSDSTRSAGQRHPLHRAILETLESRTLLHAGHELITANINFQPAGAPVPAGYLADTGQTFADRGNGFSYGWNIGNADNTRDRNANSDQRFDTLTHMQRPGSATVWEIVLPNGDYTVHIVSGDPGYTDSVYKLDVEGVRVVDGTPTNNNKFVEGTKVVNVSDGRLTVANASGSANNKINFIDITTYDPEPAGNVPPSVAIVTPANNATFAPGSSIYMKANATDSDGSIAKVEFFYNNTQINTETLDPYEATMTNVAPGTYALKAVATDNLGAQTTSTIVNVTVAASSNQTPFLGSPATLPGTIEVENFDNGGEGVAYHDTNTNNQGGGYRTGGVDIKAGGSNYVVGWTGAGEWLEYSVNVPTAGTYQLELRGATGSNGTSVHVDFDGVNKTGAIGIPNTGSWSVFNTYVRTVNLNAGPQVMRLYVDQGSTDAAADFDWIRLSQQTSTAVFNWGTAAASPVARSETCVVQVGGKVYVFGGFDTNDFQRTRRSDVYDIATNTWTQIADMKFSANHIVPVVDGNLIYLVGGFSEAAGGNDAATNQTWIYRIAQNDWVQGVSLPEARAAGGTARVGRNLYYFGGTTTNYAADKTDAWVLNLDTGTSWQPIAPINKSRNHVGATVIGTKIYMVGGQEFHDENVSNQKTLEVYDTANPQLGWKKLKDMPAGRGHISGAVLNVNGRIIVAGGTVNGNKPTADVLMYDPATDSWVALPSLPQGRKSIIGAYFNGSLYYSAGYSGVMESSTFVGNLAGSWERAANLPVSLGEVAGGVIGDRMYAVGESSSATLAYDIPPGTWSTQSLGGSTLPIRPFVGNHHAAEVLSGKLYLIGGLGGGSEGKLQIYDPMTLKWSTGPDLPFAAGSVATTVIGGQIYAAGGIVGNATTNQVARFNPGTNSWSTLPPMPQGRNHTAAATDGSKFYVFGGRDGGNAVGNGFNTVQIFNPATNSWTSSDTPGSGIAPLPQARGGMGKSVFFNGEFYIVGGETLNGSGATSNNVYNRVDIYNPSTNTWRLGPTMPTARHGIFPLLISNRLYVFGGGTAAGSSSSNLLEVLNLD